MRCNNEQALLTTTREKPVQSHEDPVQPKKIIKKKKYLAVFYFLALPSFLPQAPGPQTTLCLDHQHPLFLHLILESPIKVKVEISSLGLFWWFMYLQGLSRWSPRPLAHPRQDERRPFPRGRRLDCVLLPSLSPALPSLFRRHPALRNSSPSTLFGGFPFSRKAR